jgi:hypothetical protein
MILLAFVPSAYPELPLCAHTCCLEAQKPNSHSYHTRGCRASFEISTWSHLAVTLSFSRNTIQPPGFNEGSRRTVYWEVTLGSKRKTG